MPTLEANFRSLISPLGIVRLLEIFFSCTAFSLAAVYHYYSHSYGDWSMFTWCFCFAVSVCIVILEVIGLAPLLPLSWQDFTSAFSMLASLMIFTTSIIFPSWFVFTSCRTAPCNYNAAATAMSCFCFLAYAVEVGMTRAKEGEVSTFLATVPGLLKVFEAYVACLIFSLVNFDPSFYKLYPGLQWCVAVYCICFIITMMIIILTIGRCLGRLPFPVEKALVGINILFVLMYLTAAIVWPIYSFKYLSRPDPCEQNYGQCWLWNNLLGVTFLNFFNLIAYIVDLIYSSKMVFLTTPA